MKNKSTSFKHSAAAKEIKALLPYYIGCLVLLSVISVILMLAGVGGANLIFGALIGNAVSFISFVLMALTAEKSLHMTEKSAKLALNGGYAVRYIAMFLILGFLMYYGIINPVTALLPLFVPKVAYTVQAFREKSEF